MDAKIEQALKTYDKIGYGGAGMPGDQLDAVHDLILSTLHRSGIDLTTAVKLVHLIEGGSWSKGWESGYDSAKKYYSPSFSLTADGQGSREFRDEIKKSEA